MEETLYEYAERISKAMVRYRVHFKRLVKDEDSGKTQCIWSDMDETSLENARARARDWCEKYPEYKLDHVEKIEKGKGEEWRSPETGNLIRLPVSTDVTQEFWDGFEYPRFRFWPKP